ncbi:MULTISPECIES: VC2046/SO_2500 family protein [unclassified Vibrio]|uniref:VC2046/SO_2500 family protein n=1 Tax=Vibrio sp. HB236076 TaxID=3232307 RepID=A0AB39HE26_9VIBR|nr:VC2046/SO_2500 family protein [Vibrio sp. HB161653]MDP5253752.1 VC2046/SO_2500 family protein [Vibrio sp. HB161653]
MSVNTINHSPLINELQFNDLQGQPSVNQAINQGRRSDFALLLSMLSDDVQERLFATETKPETLSSGTSLREQLSIAPSQPLIADHDSYDLGAQQSQLLHSASLVSSHLSHYLRPEGLCVQPQNTAGLPEACYHNLSSHQQRRLKATANPIPSQNNSQNRLYEQLNTALKKDRLHCAA